MTLKTTGWEELHFAEVPAVESLESLGYTCVPPEAPERGHTLGVRRQFPGKTGFATGCQATVCSAPRRSFEMALCRGQRLMIFWPVGMTGLDVSRA